MNAPETSAERSQVFELQEFASSLAHDVQTLSHELHSSRVAILGPVTSMRLFCTEFSAQHGITIDFESEELPAELSSDVSLCLYRVLQEALHNAAKHSGGRQFSVRVWTAPRHVHLEVRDDGAGFNVQKVREGSGLGLVSMQERVKLVSGELAITSIPQHGTTVHARVPLTA
jgi:signal transduction histidine kinase